MTTDLISLGRAVITGQINCVTGLHIGAGKDSIEIGGVDLPVVRHPHTRDPYIPGSSLRGKLRFLLEWAFGTVRNDGRAWGFDAKESAGQTLDDQDRVLRIFGNAIRREDWKRREQSPGPTRLVIRDAHINAKYAADVQAKSFLITEEKMEVSIDRIAGKALDGGLRRIERVVAGAIFDLEMVFRLYDTGDGGARDRACLNWVIAGLGLIEQDAIGGSGSRGYGKVSFEDLVVLLPDGHSKSIGGRHRQNPFPVDRAPAIVSF